MLHATHSDCLQKGCKRGETFSSCVIFNLPQLSCCCCKCIHYSFMFLTHSRIRFFLFARLLKVLHSLLNVIIPSSVTPLPLSLLPLFAIHIARQAFTHLFIRSFIRALTHSFSHQTTQGAPFVAFCANQLLSRDQDAGTHTSTAAGTQLTRTHTHTHRKREDTHTQLHTRCIFECVVSLLAIGEFVCCAAAIA